MSLADMMSGLREAVAIAYFHTATVTRKAAGAPDADGQPTKSTTSTAFAALPCYITPLQPQSAGALGVTVGADGLIEAGLFQLICDYGTAIKVNDTLAAVDDTSAPLFNGTTFRLDRMASNPAHVLALLRTYA